MTLTLVCLLLPIASLYENKEILDQQRLSSFSVAFMYAQFLTQLLAVIRLKFAPQATYAKGSQLTQADPVATRYTSALLQYPHLFPSQ